MTAGTRTRAAVALALVLAVGGGTAAAVELTGRLPSATALPRPAPELAGPGLHGEALDLDELRGSVVVVPAWASWCAPCEEEVPVLEQALDRLGPDGLVVLGMNVHDRPRSARAFTGPDGPPGYPSVLDEDGRFAVEWGLRGVPETFVVDRDGDVVAHHLGAVTAEWVESTVAPVVAQP